MTNLVRACFDLLTSWLKHRLSQCLLSSGNICAFNNARLTCLLEFHTCKFSSFRTQYTEYRSISLIRLRSPTLILRSFLRDDVQECILIPKSHITPFKVTFPHLFCFKISYNQQANYTKPKSQNHCLYGSLYYNLNRKRVIFLFRRPQTNSAMKTKHCKFDYLLNVRNFSKFGKNHIEGSVWQRVKYTLFARLTLFLFSPHTSTRKL